MKFDKHYSPVNEWLPQSNKKLVKTIQNMKKSVLVKGKAIYDMDVILGRLIAVGQLSSVNLGAVFSVRAQSRSTIYN